MEAGLPKDDPELWDWLTAIDETRRAALPMHCVSFGVKPLYEKGDRYGGPLYASRTASRRRTGSPALPASTW